MEKKNVFIRLWRKYREQISYMLFGAVTTAANIAGYAVMSGLGASTGVANAVAWALSVVTAYLTNRKWVFGSQSRGVTALREFGAFVGCRLATGVLDEAIMIIGVDVLHLWGLGVKAFSNALVIVLNYVFSKRIIFRKKD